jgi:hypothetical protein
LHARDLFRPRIACARTLTIHALFATDGNLKGVCGRFHDRDPDSGELDLVLRQQFLQNFADRLSARQAIFASFRRFVRRDGNSIFHGSCSVIYSHYTEYYTFVNYILFKKIAGVRKLLKFKDLRQQKNRRFRDFAPKPLPLIFKIDIFSLFTFT